MEARKTRQRDLKKRYGLTEAEFQVILEAQGFLCAICDRDLEGKTGKLGPHVDHCHKTSQVRGILCSWCNRGIGLLGDSVKNLRSAGDYLQKARSPVKKAVTLPKRIKIKKRWWKVISVEEYIIYDGRKCRGLCDGNERVITIYVGQRPRMVMSTFWHEILHAIEFEYGIPIPHRMIYATEGAIADVIIKNPEIGALAS